MKLNLRVSIRICYFFNLTTNWKYIYPTCGLNMSIQRFCECILCCNFVLHLSSYPEAVLSLFLSRHGNVSCNLCAAGHQQFFHTYNLYCKTILHNYKQSFLVKVMATQYALLMAILATCTKRNYASVLAWW